LYATGHAAFSFVPALTIRDTSGLAANHQSRLEEGIQTIKKQAPSVRYTIPMNDSTMGKREWLNLWAHEIPDVTGVGRIGPAMELATVPGIHEELDSAA